MKSFWKWNMIYIVCLHLWIIQTCNFSIIFVKYKDIQNLKLDFSYYVLFLVYDLLGHVSKSYSSYFFSSQLLQWLAYVFHAYTCMQMLLDRHMLSEQEEENKNPSTRYFPRLGYVISATKALICFYSYNPTLAVIGRTGGCRYG